jgi:hypothetical protein
MISPLVQKCAVNIAMPGAAADAQQIGIAALRPSRRTGRLSVKGTIFAYLLRGHAVAQSNRGTCKSQVSETM